MPGGAKKKGRARRPFKVLLWIKNQFVRQLDGKYFGSTELFVQVHAKVPPPFDIGEKISVALFRTLFAACGAVLLKVAVIRPVSATLTLFTYLPVIETAAARPADSFAVGQVPWLE